MTTPNKIQLGIEIKKPIRSMSGVTPLTVVLAPRKCNHGTCIYCPGGDTVPQSYTNKSPAIMRASKLDYDPYRQVVSRMNVLKLMKHQTDKIEIIILGGTFLQYPKEYKYTFIKSIYDALNEKESRSLEESKKINETAKHRCVALCIENRPDNCSLNNIKEMLEFGCTRVELGVQIPDDEIYKKINRGHIVKDVINATRNLKEVGFKVGYHLMPGLPGSSKEKDLELFKLIFKSEDFKPDQLKIYPCQVIENSPLAKFHKIICFKPYTREETKELLTEMLNYIPKYCRVMRMMREFPREKLIDGIDRLDIRKDIEEDIKEKNLKIKEIRFREIGFALKENKKISKDIKLKILEYKASNGIEYFIEGVNSEDILFGLLRLRIGENSRAIIREIHVYGNALSIGEKSTGESQHSGLGKRLLNQAEIIAKENDAKKLSVISGVGAREYYRKLGYSLDKARIYMEKEL